MPLPIRKLIVKARMLWCDIRGHHGHRWDYESTWQEIDRETHHTHYHSRGISQDSIWDARPRCNSSLGRIETITNTHNRKKHKKARKNIGSLCLNPAAYRQFSERLRGTHTEPATALPLTKYVNLGIITMRVPGNISIAQSILGDISCVHQINPWQRYTNAVEWALYSVVKWNHLL